MKDEYIRREDVVDALKAQADTMRTWVERYAEQRRGILTAVNIVEDIKPADVAPVVHSQWKYKCGEIQCPECGNRIHRIDLSGCLNFCPNCGAKMDAQREE